MIINSGDMEIALDRWLQILLNGSSPDISSRSSFLHYVHLAIRPEFFYFLFYLFFHNKLVSEDEIKIKIKFIRTIFQLN